MAQSGTKSVTTAGTRETLVAASQVVNGPIAIRADADNTKPIHIGGSDVDATIGFALSPTDPALVIPFVGDLFSIYLDVEVNGEGVTWLILEY
jgi:hypothetical protein